jgi:putative transposase
MGGGVNPGDFTSFVIVAGEMACYTLLTFIALKMELHWRSNPLGEWRKNLPIWKRLEH